MRRRTADGIPLPYRAPARRHLGKTSSAIAACAAVLALLGCSTVPITGSAPPPESRAISDPETTRLGRLLQRRAPSDRHSGFEMLTSGDATLAALRELSAVAERTLDLQYYDWRKDGTGKLLMAEVLGAADRGVAVRLLLDDWRSSWSDDELLTFDAHPQIEIRLFNPRRSRTTPVLDLMFDFSRITHRMHNKVFVADNAVAVLGGRNVGDEYFLIGDAARFRDLDLLAAGPVVREVSDSFDAYWNSEWSVPVERIPRVEATVGDHAALARAIEDSANVPVTEDATAPANGSIEHRLPRLIWTPSATLAADAPDKPATSASELLRELGWKLAGEMNRELLIEIAYLVPRRVGTKALCQTAARGVRVRILTNSLASTDVVGAYAAYRDVRTELLRCGVELYELRENAGVAVHTKAAVIDDRYVLVGSFNIDPRSVNLNTEVALVVESRALARAVTRFIEAGLAPERASRLVLDGDDTAWIRTEGGHMVTLRQEPGRTFWRGLLSDLLAVLPIDGQM